MATFTYTPLYAWDSSVGHRVKISALQGGKEQRKYKGPEPREWTLAFRTDPNTIEGILAFYSARKGQFETFLWIPPGTSETVTVRFGEERLEAKWQGLDLGAIPTLTLREVL